MTSSPACTPSAAPTASEERPPIPSYLTRDYWWAYVHPKAVAFFERDWLVNLILFGQYARLRDAALRALCGDAGSVRGRTLQVACVYGNLTARLRERLSPDGQLTVMDVLPVQLENLRKKLPLDARVQLVLGDATKAHADGDSYQHILMFFLLHEQPSAARQASLLHAMQALQPGGQLVIVDYHRPPWWHPLRPLLSLVFWGLEPYARDLWTQSLEAQLPQPAKGFHVEKTLFLGGVYQMLTLTRPR